MVWRPSLFGGNQLIGLRSNCPSCQRENKAPLPLLYLQTLYHRPLLFLIHISLRTTAFILLDTDARDSRTRIEPVQHGRRRCAPSTLLNTGIHPFLIKELIRWNASPRRQPESIDDVYLLHRHDTHHCPERRSDRPVRNRVGEPRLSHRARVPR